MDGIYLNRGARNRWRAFAVWSMLPLAVLNGRTIEGCGCKGEFQTVCQCAKAECSKCTGTDSSCPYCKNKGQPGSQSTLGSATGTIDNFALHTHRCIGAALREVVPAILDSADTRNELNVSTAVLDAIDLPAAVDEAILHVMAVMHASAPPGDLVVNLRRLLI